MSEKKHILFVAATHGFTVDREGFPPSDRGIVRRLQRQGYLKKVRRLYGWGNGRTSIMLATDKGKDWLKRKGIEINND